MTNVRAPLVNTRAVAGGRRDGCSFADTPWPLLSMLRRTSAGDSRQALEHICQLYWRPIYAFVRGHCRSREDAEDLTQSFLMHLLEKDTFAHADAKLGRFRSYIIGALKHFLADVAKREAAAKRGNGVPLLELSEKVEMSVAAQCISGSLTPDEMIDRDCAIVVAERAWCRVRRQYDWAGKRALFETLRDSLFASRASAHASEQLAAELGRPMTTIRSDLSRLRHRFVRALVTEVRALPGCGNVDEELRRIRRIISSM